MPKPFSVAFLSVLSEGNPHLHLEPPQNSGYPTLCSTTAKGGIEPALSRRSRTLTRLLQTATLTILMVFMLGATDPTTRFNKLGHEMICTCSCGQILMECNHVGCGVSGPMIDELRTQMVSGGTDTSILNWFAAKYGSTVLASPMRGGFDNIAWIAPLLVFFLATIGTAVIVRVWKMRSTSAPLTASAPGHPADKALRDRIRRETEY